MTALPFKKAKEPDDEKPPNKGEEKLFVAATKAEADNTELRKGYLGSRETIFRLLQFYAHNALEVINKSNSKTLQRRAVQEPSREIAAILLGMRNRLGWEPVPGWNQPGGVDVFLAKWCGSSEKEPRRRVESAMVNMFQEILEVAVQANYFLDEQVAWQIPGILEKYTSLCLGIDLAMQEMAEE